MAGSGSEDRVPRVQSVDRAMMLLRAVAAAAPEDSTAARLAETCGLNRATSWRILHTLEAHDIVSLSQETGRWSVGDAVVDIAQSAGTDNIIALARPRLERLSLQTGETAALAVWRQGALTYVEEVGPPAIVSATWLGQTVPLHATSTGKVLLAFGDGQRFPAVPGGVWSGSPTRPSPRSPLSTSSSRRFGSAVTRPAAASTKHPPGVSRHRSSTDLADWSPYSASGVPARA